MRQPFPTPRGAGFPTVNPALMTVTFPVPTPKSSSELRSRLQIKLDEIFAKFDPNLPPPTAYRQSLINGDAKIEAMSSDEFLSFSDDALYFSLHITPSSPYAHVLTTSTT